MKSCGLIVNKKKAGAYKLLGAAAAWLNEHGVLCYTDVKRKLAASVTVVPRKELFTKPDFLIVLGGDGTILDVASGACESGIPVLGVNLGNLGYLTDTEPHNMLNSLRQLINGKYITENRMTLKAKVHRLSRQSKEAFEQKPEAETIGLALNEFAIAKGVGPNMISFDIRLNGAYINTYRADGVIIATPTGSTAYNLSAGGPVLKPDGDMIAITPICPHGLFALPCVVGGGDIITVCLPENTHCADISADGKHTAKLKPGDFVEIKAGDKPMRIIKTNNLSFFDVLRQKMVK